MKKLKLLLIVEAMGGGVRRHIVDLIKGLDKEKFEIMLLYSDSRADKAFESNISDISHIALLKKSPYLIREINPKIDIKALKHTKQVIKEFKPDIVHCHSSKAGVIGRYAAKKLKVKKVYYTPHAYSFQTMTSPLNPRRWLFIKIERWFSRHATNMTFNVSHGEKNVAIQNNIDSSNKFLVIYNGIPDYYKKKDSFVKKELCLDDNSVIIGTASRLSCQKDPITFVKIANMVVKQDDNVHFIYIGDGPLFNKVNTYISNHGLNKNMHLFGFREDVQNIIKDFDLYLCTSNYEGMSYSLIESLCAGVPIAATKVIGNDEVVIPGLSGELFEAGNVKNGFEVVCNMLKNKEKYSYNKIRKDFIDRFLIDNMINKIQKAYLDGVYDKE